MQGSAAVAFMSYTDMADILTLYDFDMFMSRRKSMMSTVVSVTLPQTTNTHLNTPVNLTFTHITVSYYTVQMIYLLFFTHRFSDLI